MDIGLPSDGPHTKPATSYEWRRGAWRDVGLDPHLLLVADEEIRMLLGGGDADAPFVSLDGPTPPAASPSLQPVLGVLSSTTAALPEEVHAPIRRGATFTGSVASDDITKVRRHPSVVSLKRGLRFRRSLDVATRRALALSDGSAARQRRTATDRRADDVGRVIVAVVDYNCLVAHPEFLHPDGTTRFRSIWDQRSKNSDPSHWRGDFRYGREFTKAEIDHEIKVARGEAAPNLADAVQTALEMPITPEGDDHGTHVLALAAGTQSGVANDAELVFIRLDECRASEPVGSTRDLMDAINYAFDVAEIGADGQARDPVVVNLSLESNSGPHDGSTPFDRAIDDATSIPGRAVVLSAGNSALASVALGFETSAGADARIQFEFSKAMVSDNPLDSIEMDLWYEATGDRRPDPKALADRLRFSLGVQEVPEGDREPAHIRRLTRRGDGMWCLLRRDRVPGSRDRLTPVLEVAHRACDPLNGANEFRVAVRPGQLSECLKLDLSLGWPEAPAATKVRIDAWIDFDEHGRRGFFEGTEGREATTVNGLACGNSTIAVGAWDARDPNTIGIVGRSGHGRTRGERSRPKPELSAPGAGVEVVRMQPGVGSAEVPTRDGTSYSAPLVAGIIARLYAAAAPRRLPIGAVRSLLLDAGAVNDAEAWREHLGLVCARADAAEAGAEVWKLMCDALRTPARVLKMLGEMRRI